MEPEEHERIRHADEFHFCSNYLFSLLDSSPPITLPFSLPYALLYCHPFINRRTSGHCMGAFRAVNFTTPPPPATNVVSVITYPTFLLIFLFLFLA